MSKVRIFLMPLLCVLLLVSGSLTALADTVDTVDEEFKIGVFWPPVADYTNEKQYDYLKEAHIDVIQNTHTGDLDTIEINKKMLNLAAERGMTVNVADYRMDDIFNASDEEIAQIVEDYKGHPGLEGYYIRDEPSVDEFPDAARVYKKMLELDPNAVPYVNHYPHYTTYFQKWVDEVGASNLKYLSYDFYPFAEDGTVRSGYFTSLDKLRKVGLKNNVKTANYLQSVGIPGVYTRPTEDLLRYNVYTSLAYGLKSVTWFTWWTPTNRGEPFTDAIITADGKKTDLFEPVKNLNYQMKQLGPTLMKLDALNVFHSGEISEGVPRIPDYFFWKPVNTEDNILLSYFKDRETGRIYIMAVNKSLNETKTMDFQIDVERDIDYISEISKETGKEKNANYDSDTGVLSDNFLPGEGKLYALPLEFDFQFPVMMADNSDDATDPWIEVDPERNWSNLAINKQVTASSDIGAWGWSLQNVVDGERNSIPGSLGWTSYDDRDNNHTEWITIDLGRVHDINIVNLYPRNDDGSIGNGFPNDFTIQLSPDGKQWQPVVKKENYKKPSSVQRFSFPMTATRYVKVEATDLRTDQFGDYLFQLAEIEVYSQDELPSLLKFEAERSEIIVGKTTSVSVKEWIYGDNGYKSRDDQKATYSSSDTSVATVDKFGNVTGISDGVAEVQVIAYKKDGTEVTETVDITVKSLPDRWDVEFYNSATGVINYADDAFEINANGQGIGQEEDRLVYLYEFFETPTPLTIEANIESLYQVNDVNGVKGNSGLMFRDGLDQDGTSDFASLSVNPIGRTILTARSNDTLTIIYGDYVTFPVELKLSKKGNMFTGFYKKADGEWTPINNNVGKSKVKVKMGKEFTSGVMVFSGVNDKDNYTKVTDINFAIKHVPPKSSADMKKLVERFAEEGAITNQKAAHDLNVHLTAVNLFEEKEVAEKVVKHLQGFNHLLDHQKENEWLSKEAYLVLKADTDYLIRKWQ